MPSAIERAVRLAVRFMTARAPPILWKNRSLSVVLDIFAAWRSTDTGSSTSVTSPCSRIFSMNSRIVPAPPLCKGMFNIEVVENPGDDHVNHIFDSFGRW